MTEILLDALIDSFKVFIITFFIYVIVSFFEQKLVMLLRQNHKYAPFVGSLLGLIPQCSFSIVASELYIDKGISFGTLIAIFIACSDESIPILLSDTSKSLYVLPLIITKLILGFVIGFLCDYLFSNKFINKQKAVNTESNVTEKPETPIHKHLIHPLIHTFKIFLYVLIINLIFGLLIFWIGENNIMTFLETNQALGPLLATIIGLIPNCSSSILTTELFLKGGLSFGSLIAGLIINSGLGIVFLFRKKATWRDGLIALSILAIVALSTGYLFYIFNL